VRVGSGRACLQKKLRTILGTVRGTWLLAGFFIWSGCQMSVDSLSPGSDSGELSKSDVGLRDMADIDPGVLPDSGPPDLGPPDSRVPIVGDTTCRGLIGAPASVRSTSNRPSRGEAQTSVFVGPLEEVSSCLWAQHILEAWGDVEDGIRLDAEQVICNVCEDRTVELLLAVRGDFQPDDFEPITDCSVADCSDNSLWEREFQHGGLSFIVESFNQMSIQVYAERQLYAVAGCGLNVAPPLASVSFPLEPGQSVAARLQLQSEIVSNTLVRSPLYRGSSEPGTVELVISGGIAPSQDIDRAPEVRNRQCMVAGIRPEQESQSLCIGRDSTELPCPYPLSDFDEGGLATRQEVRERNRLLIVDEFF